MYHLSPLRCPVNYQRSPTMNSQIRSILVWVTRNMHQNPHACGSGRSLQALFSPAILLWGRKMTRIRVFLLRREVKHDQGAHRDVPQLLVIAWFQGVVARRQVRRPSLNSCTKLMNFLPPPDFFHVFLKTCRLRQSRVGRFISDVAPGDWHEDVEISVVPVI